MESCFKLPSEVILSQSLSYSAKKICASLYAYSNCRGTRAQSVKYLAVQNHCCPDTVTADIDSLARHGYVSRVRSLRYSKTHRRAVRAQNTYVCKMTAGKFTLIPRALFRAKISFSAFTLMCYFYLLKGQKHRAFPSHSRIFRDLGMSRSTQQRAIRELSEEGLLHVEHCLTKLGCYAANSYFPVAKAGAFSDNFKSLREVSAPRAVNGQRWSLDVDVTAYLSFFDNAMQGMKMLC